MANWLVPLIILAAVVATFAHCLKFQFVFDDPILIVGNPFIHSAANIPRFFTEDFWSGIPIAQKSFYRPLSLLWLLTNWKLFGADPTGWHAASILLHALNILLVYLLAFRFVRPQANGVLAAGAAATVFALHPIQSEAVSWISCFNDLLACLFVLISFHAYCSAREIAVAPRSFEGRHKALWYGLSLAGYAIAVLYKEPAVLFPLIPLVCELIGPGRLIPGPCGESAPAHANSAPAGSTETDTPVRPAFLLLVPYLAIAACYFVLRTHALGTATTPQSRILYWSTELLTIPEVMLAYLVHLAWPAGLSPFYDTPYQQNLSFSAVILPLLILMLAAGLLLCAARRTAVVLLFASWTLIFLAPTLHLGIQPRGELMHDRYLYMPMVGISVLGGLGIAAIARRWASAPDARRALTTAVALIGIAFAVITYHQSSFWEDNLTLYSRGVAIAPLNGTAANNLGAVLLGRGQWDEAMALFQRAVEYAPNLFLAHYDMGLGYYEVGKYAEAEDCFKRALHLMPNDPESNLFLGMSYYHTNRLPGAVESVRKAIALKPDGVGYHFALAIMLKDSGDLTGARAEFEAELRRDPNHQPTLEQLRLLNQTTTPPPAAPPARR